FPLDRIVKGPRRGNNYLDLLPPRFLSRFHPGPKPADVSLNGRYIHPRNDSNHHLPGEKPGYKPGEKPAFLGLEIEARHVLHRDIAFDMYEPGLRKMRRHLLQRLRKQVSKGDDDIRPAGRADVVVTLG